MKTEADLLRIDLDQPQSLEHALFVEAQKVRNDFFYLVIRRSTFSIPFGLSRPRCVVARKCASDSASKAFCRTIEANTGAGGVNIGLSLRNSKQPTKLRPYAYRPGRRFGYPRSFVASPERHRSLPQSTNSLWLRRFPKRLRRYTRLQRLSRRLGSDVFRRPRTGRDSRRTRNRSATDSKI